MKVETDELLPIGRFARVAGLTVKALRHYDEIGLLPPAHVDESTGYRRYRLAQARRAEAIARLRRLEVPLEEIRVLLDLPPADLRERLAVHRARLEGRVVETQRVLAELDRLINGKETLVPEIGEEAVRTRLQLDVQEVPETHLLVIRERGHMDDMPTIVQRNIYEVHAYVGERGVAVHGPPRCMIAFAGDDGMTEVEAGWPVPEGTPGRGRIEAKTLPTTRALVMEHRGPYVELHRAYRLMAEAMDRHGMSPAADPIEVYLTDPGETPDPDDYRTRILWPIGPQGELKHESDVLERRSAAGP